MGWAKNRFPSDHFSSQKTTRLSIGNLIVLSSWLAIVRIIVRILSAKVNYTEADPNLE
jgi:hypothetical protein